MIRKANAVWRGGLKDGSGQVSTESGALKTVSYNFAQRFENSPGTNPEELIAAAHAGCFSMALSAVLGGANLKPDSVETTASVSLEKDGGGFTVTKIHLDVVAKVPGATPDAFARSADEAKRTCPISRLLKGAEITMNARLA